MDSPDTWPLILQINELCQNNDRLDFLSVKVEGAQYTISANESVANQDILIVLNAAVEIELSASVLLRCTAPFSIDILQQQLFDQDTEFFLENYLPYALLPYFSRQQDEVFVISHFAQTLDGKIASILGDSRGIGNEENLIHAHRMRALCDAVLVGANTNKIDKPMLNVRYVEGRNPLKVVVGSCKDTALIQDHGKVFIDTSDFDVINGGNKDVTQILKALKEKGVRSVYLEGGAATTSSFLKQGEVDQLQIHFSSKILGSGKQGYHFEGIKLIGECVQFKNPRFVPVGDEMMFLGEL